MCKELMHAAGPLTASVKVLQLHTEKSEGWFVLCKKWIVLYDLTGEPEL